MGNKESAIGLGIVGIIAYMLIRNKGGNYVSQNNVQSEIQLQEKANLKSQLIKVIGGLERAKAGVTSTNNNPFLTQQVTVNDERRNSFLNLVESLTVTKLELESQISA